ncbi:hypothetical protein [Martelella alba]|uniref:hypothetical protein n=1 Tax=Martelella alba TaxID=2590451 RepID=UPI0014856A4A|nr:hypothetical protein [Martelella alba]
MVEPSAAGFGTSVTVTSVAPVEKSDADLPAGEVAHPVNEITAARAARAKRLVMLRYRPIANIVIKITRYPLSLEQFSLPLRFIPHPAGAGLTLNVE